MLASVLVAAVVVATPPYALFVDCSTWPGEVATKVKFRIVSRDGKAVTDEMTLHPNTCPGAPTLGIENALKFPGWRYEKGTTGVLIHGSKDAAVWSAEFTGDGWVPTVEKIDIKGDVPKKK